MTYEKYQERTYLYRKGNTKLFWNKQGFLSVDTGKKSITLQSPYKDFPKVSGPLIDRGWWGRQTWDFHASETNNKIINIYLRSRLDQDHWSTPLSTAFSNSGTWIEVWRYDLTGKFLGKDAGVNNDSLDTPFVAFSIANNQDKDIITGRGISWYSPLEEWAISLDSDLNEFFNKEIKSDDAIIRLEDWAYDKYKQIFPGQPIPDWNGRIVSDPQKMVYQLEKPGQNSPYMPTRIKFFNSKTDKISASAEVFSIKNKLLFKSTNQSNDAIRLSSSNYNFVYDYSKGMLYYNEDLTTPGWGSGGVCAILESTPKLAASHFVLN